MAVGLTVEQSSSQTTMAEEGPVVVDHGSGFTKCGYAGDDAPKSTFETVITKVQNNNNDLMIRPIQRGVIQDWNDVELLWNKTFYEELKIDPREHYVLYTESAKESKLNRERMTQLMFETFRVPATFVSTPAVLSLYGSGRTTGIVIDCGYEQTSIVPVYEGFALPHAIKILQVGGKDLTDYLMQMLNKEQSFPKYDFRTVNEIKEKYCSVALDFTNELTSTMNDQSYQLPDGTFVNLGSKERISCSEGLFQPSILGVETHGIHELVYDSIMLLDEELRKPMQSNVVLTGGSTLLSGFQQRTQKELDGLLSSEWKVKVVAAPERSYYAWIGGSILGSITQCFGSMWITKELYDEVGPGRVHRKCI